MTNSIILVFLALLATTFAQVQITNYSTEEYILIEDGPAALFYERGDVYHIINLTHYKNILYDIRGKGARVTSLIKTNLETADKLINQLIIRDRFRRGINEIGTLWKWISGSPDHDDKIKIETKLQELIESNNKQYQTNSQLFKTIEKLTSEDNNIDKEDELILKFIIEDLRDIINTINLSKNGILNTVILNIEDLEKIIKTETMPISITDVLDASDFQIIQNKEIIMLYIQYPIVKEINTKYIVESINIGDGKLQIPNQIVLYEEKYKMANCKQELNNMYCKISNETNCLTDLLNNNKANCHKIKEKNPEIKIIKDGIIFVSGETIINRKIYKGTYLIHFKNNVTINSKVYENKRTKIVKHFKMNVPLEINILKYLESRNEKLKFTNIDLIKPYIEDIKEHPILWGITLNVILILSIVIIIKMMKMYKRNEEKKNNLAFKKATIKCLEETRKAIEERSGRSL